MGCVPSMRISHTDAARRGSSSDGDGPTGSSDAPRRRPIDLAAGEGHANCVDLVPMGKDATAAAADKASSAAPGIEEEPSPAAAAAAGRQNGARLMGAGVSQ